MEHFAAATILGGFCLTFEGDGEEVLIMDRLQSSGDYAGFHIM